MDWNSYFIGNLSKALYGTATFSKQPSETPVEKFSELLKQYSYGRILYTLGFQMSIDFFLLHNDASQRINGNDVTCT